MPFYQFKCKCGAEFEEMLGMSEDTSKTQCPECGDVAERVYMAPAVVGLNKGPNMTYPGRKQTPFERPDALAECERDLRVLEEKGKLTPEMEAWGKTRIEGLKRDKEMGLIESIDYGEIGHPLENPDYEA